MTTRVFSSGKLSATPRYISQDRSRAMRGSVERGLVELITNADDSYRDLEDEGRPASGKIRIESQRHRRKPSIITVRDRAAGMTAEQMEAKLTHLGAQTSGFEKGKTRRGLLGRGAKDVAEFGTVTFESICNGDYSMCRIEPSTHYEIQTGPADEQTRRRLGIDRANGTVVSLRVEPRFQIPQHSTMVERFSRYFSLRDIFSSEDREVTLVDAGHKGQPSDRLLYRYPALTPEIDHTFMVPGYNVPAHLTVLKHPEPFTEDKHGPNKPYRIGAILVKSGCAIHDNTLFSFENDPHAARLSGQLRCDHIDDLVRAYDDEEAKNPNAPAHSTDNPIRLLSPDRDGLVPDHPLTQALYGAAEKLIKPLVDEERKRAAAAARPVESPDVRRALDNIATIAARWLEEKYRELEEEPPVGEPPEELPEGLTIIPPNEYPIPLNSTKTFSAYVKSASPLPSGCMLRIASDNDGILVLNPEVAVAIAEEDPSLGRATFRVKGCALGAEGFVSASVNGHQNVVLIQVVEPREEEPEAEEVPEGLTFERESYSLALSKQRTISLRFKPLPKGNRDIVPIVTCDCPDIVLRGRIPPFTAVRGTDYAATSIAVLGRKLHATGTLTAGAAGQEAHTTLRVVPRTPPATTVRIEPVDRDFLAERAVWSRENPTLLEIGARHPAIRPYLGPAQEDYPGRDSREYRMILAEVIAEALARRVLRARVERWPQDAPMAIIEGFYAEHGKLVREFLPRAQAELAPPNHV